MGLCANNKLVCEEQVIVIPGFHVMWCGDAYQPVKYFGVSKMALKVMKVWCDRTSNSVGIKGS